MKTKKAERNQPMAVGRLRDGGSCRGGKGGEEGWYWFTKPHALLVKVADAIQGSVSDSGNVEKFRLMVHATAEA